MNITRFNMAVLKQDIKILGTLVVNYIRSKFSALLKTVRNVDMPFPLHKEKVLQRLDVDIPEEVIAEKLDFHDAKLHTLRREADQKEKQRQQAEIIGENGIK